MGTCPGISLGLKNDGPKRRLFCYFIDQLLWAFHPILLSIQVAYLQIRKEMLLELNDINGGDYAQISEKQRQLLAYLHIYKKMELNLETIFQMSGKLVLLLFAWSETRTSQGLFSVLQQGNNTVFGIPAEIVVFLSVLFSFATFSFAQTAGIAGSRVYFPLKSRLILGLSSICACIKRVFTIIFYLTPSLGLWNILRHYQAEQIGFYKTNEKFGSSQLKVISNETIQEILIGENTSVTISNIQRGAWNNTEFEPPTLEDHYTLFKLKHYFFIFWCLLIVQSIVIIIAKNYKSEQFKKLAWFDKIFHSLECSNFAYPMHDWDHEDGDCHEHYSRMVETRKEVQLNLLINTFFNLVFLFPLYILYFNIRKRHLFLLSTIGTLDMEDTAYTQALLFCILCPILTISLSILQYVLFDMYNEKYHPFSIILQESKNSKENLSQPEGGNIKEASDDESRNEAAHL